MSSQIEPFAFVERLLEAEDPIWYRWDQDVPALINEVTRTAHQEFARPPEETGRERHSVYYKRKRVIWLLDRLVPKADSAHFESLVARGYAIFAWGRRLKPDERHLIIERAASPASGVWYESSVLAWCDSCPDEEVASLLDWAEPWEPVIKTKRVSPLLRFPEREFFRRCKDHSLQHHWRRREDLFWCDGKAIAVPRAWRRLSVLSARTCSNRLKRPSSNTSRPTPS